MLALFTKQKAPRENVKEAAAEKDKDVQLQLLYST